jgi:hypothetical protein
MALTPSITYDPSYGLATFIGPSGFTQHPMREQDARAIAVALGLPFRVFQAPVPA